MPSDLTQPKDNAPRLIERALLEWIATRAKTANPSFTLSDASAALGKAEAEVYAALQRIIATYVAGVRVTDQGILLFDFPYPLRRHADKTWAEWQELIAERVWYGFTVFFKAWIAITLVVYFVIFLIILVVAVFALSASGDDKKKSSGHSSHLLNTVFNLFLSIFRFSTILRIIEPKTDKYGYPYAHYQAKPSELNPQKKGFVASVYDFVFGPPRVERDSDHNEKEIAAFLRLNKGILTQSEVQALAGHTRHAATAFFTRTAALFGGHIHVSENGSIYALYDDFLKGNVEADHARVVYYWDEYEPDYEFSGNETSRDVLIAVLNGFNLLMSWLILSAYQESGMFFGALLGIDAVELMLGWVPLAFSLLFFLIPLLRWGWVLRQKTKQHQENLRKRLFRVVFQSKGEAKPMEGYRDDFNRIHPKEQLSQASFEALVKASYESFNFDIRYSEEGTPILHAPEIECDLTEVARLRNDRNLDSFLGKVILESK